MRIDSSTSIIVIIINWLRGNKKAFVTVCQLKCGINFDRHNDVAAHSIIILGLRKIHYNVIRFKGTMTADVMVGRAKTAAAQPFHNYRLSFFEKIRIGVRDTCLS